MFLTQRMKARVARGQGKKGIRVGNVTEVAEGQILESLAVQCKDLQLSNREE